MAPPSTRERILDAAEELFARHGIADTSLRALTRHAGVNLAAVHYHFGSKDGLVDAVIERLAEPINADRRDALDALHEAGTGAASADEVLGAFFIPFVRRIESPDATGQRTTWARLLGRLESEPPGEIARLARRHFGEVAGLYVEALAKALPDLDLAVVAERFRLANAVFTAAFTGDSGGDMVAGLPPRSPDLAARAREAIAFAIAGLAAGPARASDAAQADEAIDPPDRARIRKVTAR